MHTPWRMHESLRGRFHPDHPDDLQVIVHDGGPRITARRPEAVWVRVTGVREGIFSGVVLNQPHQLETIVAGSDIRFVVCRGLEHPLMATSEYLSQRPDWQVHPCTQCGLTELFDAPSVLLARLFPNVPEGGTVDAFTAICGACGGVQAVERKRSSGGAVATTSAAKRWWEFWK